MATADEVAAARKLLQQREAAESAARKTFELLDEQLRALDAAGITAANRVQAKDLRVQTESALQAYANSQDETAAAQRQFNTVSQTAPAPAPDPISSGAVVNNNQAARVEGAVTQNPGGNATVTLGPATVEQAIPVDTGLDPDPLKLEISQATPAPNINAGRINVAALVEGGLTPQDALTIAGGGTASTATQPGVGDGRADGPVITGNSTKDIIKATFQTSTNQRIPTQPNVLDDYASYTYQISWYLLDPFQYNTLINSPKVNAAGWSLLMQSGGAPLKGRNPRFPVDFYLDDLELNSAIGGKGVGMPHNVTKLKFKVVEPNGLTLINRLYYAVKDFYGPSENSPELDPTGSLAQSVVNTKGVNASAPPPNYINAFYCLAIKFYGYDSGGNLIAPATGRFSPNSTAGLVGPTNDTESIIEKYIAFQLTDLKFRTGPGQASKGIEYFISGTPIAMNHAFGQARGTVPFQFELSGTTVADLLIGKPAQSELKQSVLQSGRVTQATPPASNIPPGPPNPAATSGTYDALGNYQPGAG